MFLILHNRVGEGLNSCRQAQPLFMIDLRILDGNLPAISVIVSLVRNTRKYNDQRDDFSKLTLICRVVWIFLKLNSSLHVILPFAALNILEDIMSSLEHIYIISTLLRVTQRVVSINTSPVSTLLTMTNHSCPQITIY